MHDGVQNRNDGEQSDQDQNTEMEFSFFLLGKQLRY